MAGKVLNIEGSSPLQLYLGFIGLKPAIAHICIYPSVRDIYNEENSYHINISSIPVVFTDKRRIY